MDVVYDFVEGIHVFIPLIAVLFIVATLYFGRNGENKSKSEKTATGISKESVSEKSKND
ncbi:Uncharacterized protein BM_BM1030 [Brugia malayi]|uniref:Bm1030 n=1 Tax=Brugia malayi TaxID=6279 RepID=A0A0K0IMS5_BRUMA|nr:Uncharacterized protein BM_BM1030 [Brugia malayi]CTP81689.1 Bm1030 [Brugia malayi]VIO96366.1 Uncharacterized protein BM_BM1030 [Brugia malayi]